MMNRRKLGRSDLHVSELCLGTLNFGWYTDEAAAFDLLDTFHCAGGNFVQACGVGADDALGAVSGGVSESYVGRWLKGRGIPRDELVLATRLKVAPNSGRRDILKTASDIRRSCEDSLRRMQVRYLDLLVFEWSEDMPMEETLLAAESLVRAGMIRHIAAGGFPAWRVMQWVAHSARRNLCRLEAMQNEFSLASNAAVNAEATSLARVHRLGFIARAPLAGGYLAGRYISPDVPNSGRARLLRSRYSNAAAAGALAEVQAIAHARGTTPGRVALAWTLAHPGVSAALVGVSSVAQLVDLIGATELDLSFSDIQRLDWRWRMIGGSPPDNILEALPPNEAADAAAFSTVRKLSTESVHA